MTEYIIEDNQIEKIKLDDVIDENVIIRNCSKLNRLIFKYINGSITISNCPNLFLISNGNGSVDSVNLGKGFHFNISLILSNVKNLVVDPKTSSKIDDIEVKNCNGFSCDFSQFINLVRLKIFRCNDFEVTLNQYLLNELSINQCDIKVTVKYCHLLSKMCLCYNKKEISFKEKLISLKSLQIGGYETFQYLPFPDTIENNLEIVFFEQTKYHWSLEYFIKKNTNLITLDYSSGELGRSKPDINNIKFYNSMKKSARK